MKKVFQIFRQFRFTKRSYTTVFLLIVCFVMSFLFPVLYSIVNSLFVIFLLIIVADLVILFRNQLPVQASRIPKFSKLSNGDRNEITLQVENYYSTPVHLSIIDELPYQLQVRDFMIQASFKAGESRQFMYTVRPTERGEYHFGRIQLFVRTTLGLTERQITLGDPFMLASYPSFIKLKQYELMAISNRLSDLGVKRIRKIGHSTEFEQIKEYVHGDDVRTINWKATARRNQLMVNHYVDERAQNVYCLVDMGRIMKMPFEEMTLLDHAINASLVMGHVAWIKQDKPGLITFAEKVNHLVPADRKGNQLLKLQEALYNAKTNFEESNYEVLLTQLKMKVTQRSLLLLFTNFETLSGLRRQMKYLRKMASQHLLVVIFFENTEMKELLKAKPVNTFQIYEQAIAQKFEQEKKQISKELQQYGILSVYTTPQNLTVDTLNKYLEIKSRNLI